MAAVDYDLNEIADALAAQLSADTWAIDGQTTKVASYPEVVGQVAVPAVAIELDTVSYDVTMGRGSDAFTFLAHLIVSESDGRSGQRLVRQLLSSGGGITSIKDSLEGKPTDSENVLLAKRTLGGLVSYAVLTGTRNIGSINYAGAEYVGATLEIEVTP